MAVTETRQIPDPFELEDDVREEVFPGYDFYGEHFGMPRRFTWPVTGPLDDSL
jgi:hypothetical protein